MRTIQTCQNQMAQTTSDWDMSWLPRNATAHFEDNFLEWVT